MTVKPVSLGKDLSVATEADDLDSARLVSIINTNTAAIKVVIAGTGDSVEIHMAGGERLSVEKEIGANITPELAAGGAVGAGTVFGSQIAFTN
tara:strand:- start:49 stop:327 length:279 start_codon:yes stop_codon:yes gene_type:complete